jgi:hypothetical protein
MLARSPFSVIPRVGFDRQISLPVVAPLSARLDAALTVAPTVAAFGLDPAVEALMKPLGLQYAGDVIRRVRLHDGRSATVLAVLNEAWVDSDGRTRALALKRAAHAIGRRVVLVPEGSLYREPMMTNALLIAGCAWADVSPFDRLALMAVLLDSGGSMPLAEAAETMQRSDDPVAAVLCLVADRVVCLELSGPITPESRVLSRSRMIDAAEVRA